MANIASYLNDIKNAIFGGEVRGSIHDGIDAINKEVESTTSRQVDLESTFDQLVINAGNSNAEIVDARVQSDGVSYPKLGDRLNKFDEQFITINSLQTYIMSSFSDDDDSHLKIWISNDGVTWQLISDGFLGVNGELRDPSIVKYKDNYIIAYTCANNEYFGLAKSNDLVNWEHVTTVNVGTGFNHCWAPELFVDGDTLRSYVSLSSETSATNFQIYEQHTTDLLNWSSPVKCTGNLPVNIIDASLVKRDGKYYLFYKNENTKYIEYAVSNDGINNFSVQKSGDWALWGSNLEGACIMEKPNGGYRIYFDGYDRDTYYCSDSDENFENWTPKKVLNAEKIIRHCTVLTTNLNQDIFTSLTAKINKDSHNFKQTVNLGTGVTEELTLQRNTLYYVGGTDNNTINSINLSKLSIGDKVGFGCFSGSQNSFIKILKNSNTLPAKDHLLSPLKNNSDRIFYATVTLIGNTVYLVFEGLSEYDNIYTMSVLSNGTIEELLLKRNTIYYVSATNNSTINTINLTGLNEGDKVGFGCFSASNNAFVKIIKSSNILPSKDIILSAYKNNNDRVFFATVVKFGSSLTLMFEGLTDFNNTSNMITLSSGTIETYSVIPNGCYEIGGTGTCTINNIDHSKMVHGECCYFCLRSASSSAYIEIKSSSTTSVNMPGGSLKLCTANSNNEKVITLMKFGTELRLKD